MYRGTCWCVLHSHTLLFYPNPSKSVVLNFFLSLLANTQTFAFLFTMLLEIPSYPRDNTPSFVLETWLSGEARFVGSSLKFSLVSLCQDERSYGPHHQTIYEMVLVDGGMNLCKAVLNSSLTNQIDSDAPRRGATVTLKKWKLLWKTSGDPLLDRCIIFVEDISWEQAPDVDSVLDIFNRGMEPPR